MAREQTEEAAVCPSCGTANRSGSRFCNECGAALSTNQDAAVCAACHTPNPAKSRFCRNCGTSLDAKPTSPAGRSDAPGAAISPPPGGGRPGGLRGRLAQQSMLDRDDAPGVVPDSAPVAGHHLLAATPPVAAPEREPRAVRVTHDAPESASASREIVLARPFVAPDFRRRPRRVRAAVAPPVDATVSAPAPRGPMPVRLHVLVPRILHLAVLLAIIIPFVAPSVARVAGSAQGSLRTPSPETRAFALALDRLPANSPVLVSFDWEAGQIGEMQPMARAVTRRLFERQLRIIAVSLTPQGPALAQQILDDEARRAGVSYGRNYVNLGYLPGNEPALVAFATDFQQALPHDYYLSRPLSAFSALSGVQRAADVALIVDLAADEATPVRWIQQIGSRLPVPIVAGVSAGVGPALRPYTRGEPAQLSGLLVGLAGTAEFAELVGAPQPALWNLLTAQSIGQMALLVAIVLGNVILLSNRLLKSYRGLGLRVSPDNSLSAYGDGKSKSDF